MINLYIQIKVLPLLYIQTSPQAECPSLLYKNQWVQLASATINDKYQPHSKGGIHLHFFIICDLTKGFPFKYSMIRENLLQVSDRSHCLSSNLNSQEAAKCWLQLEYFLDAIFILKQYWTSNVNENCMHLPSCEL